MGKERLESSGRDSLPHNIMTETRYRSSSEPVRNAPRPPSPSRPQTETACSKISARSNQQPPQANGESVEERTARYANAPQGCKMITALASLGTIGEQSSRRDAQAHQKSKKFVAV